MRHSAIAIPAIHAAAVLAGEFHPRQASCSPLEIIIARGTTEPPNPTYGIVVGDPLFAATQSLIPALTGYPVNYPASFDCNSRDQGAADTVNHLNSQSAACPQQQYVLAGYSQGADVMHFAAQSIPPALFPRIIALTLFGDPGNRGPGQLDPLGGTTPVFPADLAKKLKEVCIHSDPVCTNNGTSVDAHLQYISATNAAGVTLISEAASYIQKQYQSGGKSGPEPAPESPGEQTPENVAALSSLGAELGSKTGTPACASTSSVAAATGTKPATNVASATQTSIMSTAVSSSGAKSWKGKRRY